MAKTEATRDGRVPCVVLTHGRDAVNRQSLEAIIACDPRLEIHVLHNPAPLEDGSFIDFARALAGEQSIRSLTRFDENISNNALLLFLLQNETLLDSDYVLLTDGDILPPQNLLDEEIGILSRHPEFMACGLRIDASRWSDTLPVKADSVERFNTSRFEAEDYVDSTTGMWMSLFRGSELRQLIDLAVANSIRLTDSNLKVLGATVLEKKWVATKESIGRELTREHPDYYDVKATSTSGFGDYSPEPAGSRYATWNHDLVCEATEWSGSSKRRVVYPPLPRALPRFRDALESDPVVAALQSGELAYGSGYVVRHSSSATRPGLALVLSRDRRPTGLPWLPGPRSIVFVGPDDPPGDQLYALDELDFGPSLITWTADEARSLFATFIRFVSAGGVIKGLAFHGETVRSQLSEGNAPAASHLPPTLRRRAAELAAAASDDRQSASAALVGMLCSNELIADLAAEFGWHVKFSKVTPGRYFTHVVIDVGERANALSLRTAGGTVL